MILPPSVIEDPNEALRKRLAAQDASWSGKARASSLLSKPMDLSVLHVKQKAKVAAAQAKDTKLHIRLASLQVLRSWILAQDSLNQSEVGSEKQEIQIARLSAALEFLLSAEGPLRDSKQEVRAAARAASIAVGEVAGQNTGAAGAMALISLLQSHVAAREKRVKEKGGGGGCVEDTSDDARLCTATKEENEAVLTVLARLAANLPASDRRIVAIAQTVLAAVASAPSPSMSSSDSAPSESPASTSSDQAQLARCLIPLARSLASAEDEASDEGLLADKAHGEPGSVDARVMDLLLSIGSHSACSDAKSQTSIGAGVVGEGGDMSRGERHLRSEMVGKMLVADSLTAITGTAFALAGITCGLGGGTMRRWGLVTLMQEWLEDSSVLARQRAIMLLSAIASVHARLSEAYVVHMFSLLLPVLADNNRGVRQCAQECLESIVSALSGSGARCLVPLMLEHLAQASSWRSRALMAKALGLLVQRRPRQLAGSC